MKAEGQKRIITFDILRVLAAYAVVLLHTPGQMWYGAFPSAGWDFSCLYLSLVRWSVPMFVMISGALFLDANRKFSIKRLYTKNVARIVYGYLFWSFVFAIVNPDLRTTMKDVLLSVMKGPPHLWFLKMLLGLYVAVPLLREIVAKKWVEVYFLIFSFITVFVMPLCLDIIGYYNETAMSFFDDIYQKASLGELMSFSAYFVLGHFLYHFSPSRRMKWTIYMLGIVSCLLVAGGSYLYAYRTNHPNGYLMDYINPFTYLETAAIFIFFKGRLRNLSPKATSLMVDISACSFGIYLIHPLVKDWLGQYLVLDPSTPLVGITMPLFAFVVFVISYLVIKAIQYIPYLGKSVT